MKMVSKMAFAAALMVGAGSVAISTPAFAKDKKDEQKAPALKLSPDVIKAAQPAQTALAAKDVATATPLVAQIEAAVKTEDDRYIAQALRLQLEAIKLQGQNGAGEAALKAPLDALIANPRTPATDLPRYVYQRGVIALNEKDYATASASFDRAKQLGYKDANIDLQMVKAKMDSGDVAGGSAALQAAIDAQTAAGGKADEQLYKYAIAKNNAKKDSAATLTWVKKWVAAYPTMKNWRDAMVLYGIQPNALATLDKAQKIDLYRLLRAGKALADQYDYEIYGQWVFDVGLPFETKAVLNEGKAAGKIPANSDNANSLLAAANKSISNEGSLAGLATRAKSAANGKLAAGTGDAYLGSGDYANAIELYKVALQKGAVDADAVNTHLGIAQALSGDKASAKASFALVKGQPRAQIAEFWTTFLDNPPVAG